MPNNIYRKFTGTIGSDGTAIVTIQNVNSAVEWDIYQISCKCGAINSNCIAIININGNFLCATPQGSLDTATGPPDVVLHSQDVLTVNWSNAIPNDPVEVGIWYNENLPVGTTPTIGP